MGERATFLQAPGPLGGRYQVSHHTLERYLERLYCLKGAAIGMVLNLESERIRLMNEILQRLARAKPLNQTQRKILMARESGEGPSRSMRQVGGIWLEATRQSSVELFFDGECCFMVEERSRVVTCLVPSKGELAFIEQHGESATSQVIQRIACDYTFCAMDPMISSRLFRVTLQRLEGVKASWAGIMSEYVSVTVSRVFPVNKAERLQSLHPGGELNFLPVHPGPEAFGLKIEEYWYQIFQEHRRFVHALVVCTPAELQEAMCVLAPSWDGPIDPARIYRVKTDQDGQYRPSILPV